MFNFRRKSHPQRYGRMAVRDRLGDIREKIKTESPVIVDGGANQGEMIDLFLKQYKDPIIHAFEPIPELASALKTKYGSEARVFIHPCALSAVAKKISFNIVNNIMSSSVLFPSEIKKGYHGEKVGITRTIEVEQVRLDEVLYCEIDILKLDLQGYELEALKGCEKLFDRIKTITTEIEFVPLYEGQPLFAEIDIFLGEKGFRLLNLYELYTHPDGQLTASDAVYLNIRFF